MGADGNDVVTRTNQQVAVAIAIRNHGQQAANAAFRQDSQFMTKKQGSKQKVAVNKVRRICFCSASYRM